MHYRLIARYIGFLLLVLAGAMATSLPWAWLADTSRTVVAFAYAAGITAAAGAVGLFIGRDAKGTILRRDALLIVGASWVLLGGFGALPFLFDGALDNPIDAYFEAISGFTTTGSTVVTDIESMSEGLHWWRCLTHWLGGMGIVVLFVAIFPHLGVGGRHLFKTEVPGPITEGLMPKIRQTSIALWLIYVALTVILAILLYMVGPSAEEAVARGLSPNAEMDVHNAIVHAFATMATGGYSTLNNSVAGFDNVAVDVVLTVFMFLAGINFSLYYLAARGRIKEAVKDHELWMYSGLVVVATVVVTLTILGTGAFGSADAAKHGGVGSSLRYAAFQVVAIITTTGFGTDNFDLYPPLPKLMLVGLMFVGGMAGSTAGGMKVFRFLVVFKGVHATVRRMIRPSAVYVVKVNRRGLARGVPEEIMAFFALGVLTFALGSLIMAALGLDITTATTAVAATLFNIGPGLSKVGAIENFAHVPDLGKVVLSICMIMGRLEFYALLVLLLPEFWRR